MIERLKHSYTHEQIGEALSWFFDAEGNVDRVNRSVKVCSVNKRGLEQIADQLNHMGIKSKVHGPYTRKVSSKLPRAKAQGVFAV